MKTPERAQSYVNAFYEAAFDRWVGTLEGAAQVLGSDQALLERLQSSEVDFAARQRALDGILPSDADGLVRNLLYTLMEHGDLGLVGDVAEGLRQRMRRAEVEPIPVEVVTAAPLGEDQRQALQVRLEHLHGTGLSYSYRVEPEILGGIIVRVGDKLIDGSVASKLAAMKQALGVTTER